MERVRGEVDGGELSVGNFDSFGIFVFVQFSAHLEADVGGGRGDELDDGAVAAQRLAAQMKQKELQLIDGRRAVQLFHDSHLKASAIVFIDARDESHYQEGHIPGACEFDPYHPEKYFPVVLPICRAAEQIVVYCNGGDCDDSETAARLLKDVGIPGRKLFIYGGGITEWTNNHQPVETGARNSGNLRISIQ